MSEQENKPKVVPVSEPGPEPADEQKQKATEPHSGNPDPPVNLDPKAKPAPTPDEKSRQAAISATHFTADFLDHVVNWAQVTEGTKGMLSLEQIKIAEKAAIGFRLAAVGLEMFHAQSTEDAVEIGAKAATSTLATTFLTTVGAPVLTEALAGGPQAEGAALVAVATGYVAATVVDGFMDLMSKVDEATKEHQSKFIVKLRNEYQIPPKLLKPASELHAIVENRLRKSQAISYEDLVKQAPKIEATSGNGLSEEKNANLATLLEAYKKTPIKQGIVPFLMKEAPDIYDDLAKAGVIEVDQTDYKLWRRKIMPGSKVEVLAKKEPYDILRAYEQMLQALSVDKTGPREINPIALNDQMRQIWHENVGEDLEYEPVPYFDSFSGMTGVETVGEANRHFYKKKIEEQKKSLGINNNAGLIADPSFASFMRNEIRKFMDDEARRMAMSVARPFIC